MKRVARDAAALRLRTCDTGDRAGGARQRPATGRGNVAGPVGGGARGTGGRSERWAERIDAQWGQATLALGATTVNTREVKHHITLRNNTPHSVSAYDCVSRVHRALHLVIHRYASNELSLCTVLSG